jgi:thiamine-monophosphate kinase
MVARASSEGSERAKVERLAALFGGVGAVGVTLGIGDDAAVLEPPAGESLVWTVDVQVEGVHFRRAWLGLGDIGWRSFVAAASDLAAMGATPWCALGSLVLPAGFDDDALDALAKGQAEAARAVGCPVVGGNLSRGGELSVTTTLLGTTRTAVTRAGARAGDGVWVAGELGLAAAGLSALSDGCVDPSLDAAIAAFRRPRVRIASGLLLAPVAHAAIDVSDGLALDAHRIAAASQVALVFDEALLLAHAGDDLRRAAERIDRPLLDLVLHGGEDYALLATSEHPIAGFTRVGDVRSGEGVWLRGGAGERGERVIDASGFDHFRP